MQNKVILFGDFETYYSLQDYSLSKSSTEQYVRDPRFATQLLALRNIQTGEVSVLESNETKTFLATAKKFLETSGMAFAAHNARFDGTVLGEIYDVHPDTLICTQAMSRACGVSRISSESLKALADFLGAPPKGGFLESMSGRTLDDLSPAERAAYKEYAKGDVYICKFIYDKMLPHMPEDALPFISMTTKMYTNPRLVINEQLLRDYIVELEAKLDEDMLKLARLFHFPDKESFLKEIRSREKFAAMLQSLGVEPPLKLSTSRLPKYKEAKKLLAELLADKKPDDLSWRGQVENCVKEIEKGCHTYAFAKSDEEMIALLEGDDEDVAELCSVRINQNSSIKKSRAETLLAVASRGRLPVPLVAYGARTSRFTAGNALEDFAKSDGIQPQNFPSRGGDKKLKQSIEALPGYTLIGCDSAQVECRVGAAIAGQDDLLELFIKGIDPYCALGPAVYGIAADEIEHKAKREGLQEFITMRDTLKETRLSSQYGISGKTFGKRLRQKRIWLKEQGDLDAHYEEASRINSVYRGESQAIVRFWRMCDDILTGMVNHLESKVRLTGMFGGPSNDWFKYDTHHDVFGREVPGICLPNGFWILYPGLRLLRDEKGEVSVNDWGKPIMVYDHRKGKSLINISIYGAKCFENLTQGLTFAVLIWQGINIEEQIRRYDHNSGMVINCHDSWIGSVPDSKADEAATVFTHWMSQTPPWMRGFRFPLASEVKKGKTYADV